MELELNKRYIVIKASDDGTFQVGDHISLCPDGAILCREAEGWVEPYHVPEATAGMEVGIDMAWIVNRRHKLQKELEDLECITNNPTGLPL